MPFEKKKCIVNGQEFEGLFELIPKVYEDSRGYTTETYSERDFLEAGLSMKFVQDNQSFSKKGVLRGLHFQTHHPQGKLVRAAIGRIFDVAVDLRKESATFGYVYTTTLDSMLQNQIYIPAGFAHGFYVLSDSAVCEYKSSNFYCPEDEGGIIWNDPVLAINWPSELHDKQPILSDKDKKQPAFDPSADYFDMNGQWIQN